MAGERRRRFPGFPGLDQARQAGFVALGFFMLLLALIGAFLPVMPTTIFLIAAAWCFGRSSPRLEAWMMAHPRFGPPLNDWRAHGAISRRAKLTAFAGMALGYGLFWSGADPSPWLAGLVAIFILAGAAYVATRPENSGRERPEAENPSEGNER